MNKLPTLMFFSFFLLAASYGYSENQSETAVDASKEKTVLISNVRLVDEKKGSEDVVVNILIVGDKLKVVTLDAVDKDDIDTAVDAENGFLLGRLVVGKPPSFLIFDTDPRESVDVLLDTKTYALFAMRRGVILKDIYSLRVRAITQQKEAPAKKPKPKKAAKKSGWLAYTPPPMTLPLSYRNEDKWNRWKGEYTSGIFIAALLADRQKWTSQDSISEQQVGDLNDYDSGEIRGIRFGVVGTLNFDKPWVYTIFASSNAFSNGFDADNTDGYSFLDYRLDIPFVAGTNLSVGKQKEPISMERMMPLTSGAMQERSMASDSMLRARNVGVVLSGTTWNNRLTWAGGVFNDWVDSGETFSESSQQFTGRITGLPLLSEDESSLLHLGASWRYNDAEKGQGFSTTPEFDHSPVFADTGEFDAEDAITSQLEASWRRGPMWFSGEYLRTEVDSISVGDPVFTGYNLGASWILSGEMRPYNKKSGVLGAVPISSSVDEGGWGAWEVAVRWSELDLSDGLIDGGEMEVYSLGLNWWLSAALNANINYRHINLDRADDSGNSSGINLRVTMMLL